MCSIAGAWGELDLETKHNTAKALGVALAHRGRNGYDCYIDSKVILTHNRLSIIDLSDNGTQPLYNEDKTVVLICNGEIYNYKTLRSQLLGRGHTFSSASDSEVILHLYEENRDNPERLLNSLTGMFAFAIWDTSKQQLFLSRDRIGIKPLYYSYINGILAFASEVKPLSLCKIVSSDIDYTSVYEYFLMGSIPAPNTLYQHIKCLDAGHYLLASNNEIKIKQYWDIPHIQGKWKNTAHITDTVETLLSDIVKEHMVADVPVGTFLSAGVDSSIISFFAAKHQSGISSFTASFPGEPEDEGEIAQLTAKRLGTTHHNHILKGNFFDKFEEQFLHIDQPFGIASALSLGRIANKANEHVKVVLSGDGGDELFGGYKRHSIPLQPSFLKAIPTPFQNSFLKIASTITRKKSLEKLRENMLLKESTIFLERTATSLPHVALSFISQDLHNKIDLGRYQQRIDAMFNKCPSTDKLNRILYVDMKTTLVDEMLTKCDRFTMANGIEGRVPLLDHRMVELAFSIPGKEKRNETTDKIPLRSILAKNLGKELAYREKTGFNSPLKKWLKSDKYTRDFAISNIDNARKVLFLDTKYLSSSIDNLDTLLTTEVFALVCIGNYFKNL